MQKAVYKAPEHLYAPRPDLLDITVFRRAATSNDPEPGSSAYTPRFAHTGNTRRHLSHRIGLDAQALFDTETRETVILKGSKIAASISDAPTFRGRKIIEKARKGCVIDNILQKDLSFNSPSTAGNIVTGRSTNGLQAWKDSDGRTLKSVLSE